MKKVLFNWAPVFFYAAIIFVLSSFSIQVPQGSDKVIHFFVYGLMGFFVARGFLLSLPLSRAMTVLLGTLGASLLGAFDEWHQSFVPGRQCSWGDFLADSLGALLGAAFFMMLGTWLSKFKAFNPQACVVSTGTCCPLPCEAKPK